MGPEPKPADRARDAIGAVSRQVDQVRRAETELATAHETNDLPRWKQAKARLDQLLVHAERAIERARPVEHDAPDTSRAIFETATREVAEAAARTPEPPNGYVTVLYEAELVAELREPTALEQKEGQLRTLLDQFTTTDLRVLMNRVRSRQPQDTLANEIWTLGADTRVRLTEFMHNVDRRKARERAAALRPALPTVAAPEPETIDTRMRRALDAPDVGVALEIVFAAEDGSVRRALAERFRRYRPGSGDDIAARFIRLDDAAKQKIFAQLAHEKLRDAVHPQVEASFTVPAPIVAIASTQAEPEGKDPMRVFRETSVPRHDDGSHAAPVAHAVVVTYLAAHEKQLWAALRSSLTAMSWAVPKRVTLNELQFDTVLVSELQQAIGNFSNEQLGQLVYPEDVFAALAPYVPSDGKGWNAAVATIIGQHLRRSVAASVVRMSARYVDATDVMGMFATPADLQNHLSLSHPIDRIVSHVLSRNIEIAYEAGRRPNQRAVLRPVMLRWQGAANPARWNVVRVDPSDATCEEMAATREASGVIGAASEPYEIANAAPLFSIPTAWAMQVPAARAGGSLMTQLGPFALGDDNVDARLAQLATSTSAHELVHAQAGHARQVAIAPTQLDRTFEESLILLEAIRKALTPWELGGRIAPEALWTATMRESLHHAQPGELADWLITAPAQRQRMVEVLGLIKQVAVSAMNIDADKRADSLARQRTIMSRLAMATATSHLGQTSDTAMREAFAELRKEGLAQFDVTAAQLDQTMDDARERIDSETNSTAQNVSELVHDNAARAQMAPYAKLRERAEGIQARVAGGEEVDPAELEEVELGMEDTTIRERLHAMQMELDHLAGSQTMAAEGLMSHVMSFAEFRDLDGAIRYIHQAVSDIYVDLTIDAKASSKDGVSRLGEGVAIRRAAIRRAQARFAGLSKNENLNGFLKHAASVIQHQQTRTSIAKLITLIAASIVISVATGGLATGSVMAQIVALTAEVVGNGTAQFLVSAGERNAEGYASALGENLFYATVNKFVIGNAFAKGEAVLAAQLAQSLDRQLATVAVEEAHAMAALRKVSFAGWALKETGAISLHAITGMALGATYAHARAALGGPEASSQTVDDFEIQALSIAIGKHIHLSISKRMALNRELQRQKVDTQGLLAAEAKAHAAAATVIETKKGEDALTALEACRQLMQQELRVYEELAAHPVANRPSAEEAAKIVGSLRTDLGTLKSAQMLDVQWRLLGLNELSPDIWTGGAAELDHAISQARALDLEVRITEQSADVTHAMIAGKPVEFHVVSAAKPMVVKEGAAVTAYGHLWPGEVPDIAPPEVKATFHEAARRYESLKKDGYQGASAGRLQWTKYLVEHGIAVDGYTRVGEHEVHEIERPHVAPPTVTGLAAAAEMGPRSGNTGYVTHDQCNVALDRLVTEGGMLNAAIRTPKGIEIRLTDGRLWTIDVVEPRRMADSQMSDVQHGATGDIVWVSDRITKEQVPRALGAAVGKALKTVGYGRATADVGALDAMFAHRQSVSEQKVSTERDIKARAIKNSKLEALERIDAEMDMQMFRMGLFGPDASGKIDALPSGLATNVRARLQGRHIGFDAAATLGGPIAGPKEMPASGLATSSVLPAAPKSVHAYGAADYEAVLALRTEMAIIGEIDQRTQHRDQPGTNGGAEIAKGETERRAAHVARAKGLLESLQLGGSDHGYLETRLAELERVFPGAADSVVPAVRARIQRRANATNEHEKAEAFRRSLADSVTKLRAEVRAGKPFTTKQVVVGAGPAAMNIVASVRGANSVGPIPSSELLIIGMDNLLDRIDPAFLWGQRAAVYERALPTFAGTRGEGSGGLLDAVEDPGEFMHVGELRDALDNARERLGAVPLPEEVTMVESSSERQPNTPPWQVASHPVRVRFMLDGEETYVYTELTKLATGSGNPNYPPQRIMSTADRDGAIAANVMYPGEQLLQGKEVAGKRVLVLAFGPTGAWTARAAADEGASRVDWASLVGGELGAGARKGDSKSNDWEFNNTMKIDRVQSAADPAANIHVTHDRIVHIEFLGETAKVTYAHGPGENAEIYDVTYDAVVPAMGYSNTSQMVAGARPAWAKPTDQDVLGGTAMSPKAGNDAPITADTKTQRIEVHGVGAAEGINVRTSDREELVHRGEYVQAQISADSPNERVLEGVGISTGSTTGGNGHE
ncbi:hypothetical protein BH11MYX1_BH11MYX1_42880 [soil metagenome]